MLTIFDRGCAHTCRGRTRREFLRVGGLALGGLGRIPDHVVFVATDAEGEVRAAHDLGEEPGQLGQELVARGVPVGVVDRLEVVEVDERDRQRPLPGLDGLEEAAERLDAGVHLLEQLGVGRLAVNGGDDVQLGAEAGLVRSAPGRGSPATRTSAPRSRAHSNSGRRPGNPAVFFCAAARQRLAIAVDRLLDQEVERGDGAQDQARALPHHPCEPRSHGREYGGSSGHCQEG